MPKTKPSPRTRAIAKYIERHPEKSMEQIAARFGVTRQWVSDIAARFGIAKPRSHGGGPPLAPADTKQMRRLRRQGLTFEKIGKALGCSTSTVARRLGRIERGGT